MFRTVLLAGLGAVLVLLGLIGLVLPLMPGVVFLLAAGCCFAALSPGIRTHLERYPAWRGFNRRWHASRGLPLLRRTQLAFWLAAEAAMTVVHRR